MPAPLSAFDPSALSSLLYGDAEDGSRSMFVPKHFALDRRSNRDLVSVAGTGFVHAGELAAGEATQWQGDPVFVENLRQSLRDLNATNPPENGGWLSHFTDAEGHPIVGRKGDLIDSEVSTIDTALYYAGHRDVIARLRRMNHAGPIDEYEREVEAAIAAIDLSLVTREGLISHGFHWSGRHGESEFQPIEHLWNDTSEGVLVYWLFGDRLIAEGYRDDWWTPKIERIDYPLFVYVYPLCFRWEGMGDDLLRKRATWRAYLVDALREQHTRYGYVGQTATDGPDGYSVDSATLVSPILLAALSGDPELPFIDETLQLLVDRGVSPMAMNYDFATSWQGDDVISIDLGSAILAWQVIEELGALK